MMRRGAILILALLLSLAVASLRAGALANARQSARRGADTADAVSGSPLVDGGYVQARLAWFALHDGRREAGQDTNLPRSVNAHDEFAADWLAELRRDLAGLPLRVTRQTFPLPGFRGRPPKTPGTNLIVTLPGTMRANEWVLLVAHYDGTPTTTQSAYDDASGCSILLGVARALAPAWRHHRPARTVAFILFDGEEQGLIGSFAFARAYQQGAPYRIVALYNEEQNGVGYPVRPFGIGSNPTLPEHILVTPRRQGSAWANPVAPAYWPQIDAFSAALAAARDRAFAELQAIYPRLPLRSGGTYPTFTPADRALVPVADDNMGGSDEAPFERLDLLTATFIGNYDYYPRYAPGHRRWHPAWSYPFDTPLDTMSLLERTASGLPRPSPALAAALALPGQLTVEMLDGSRWGTL